MFLSQCGQRMCSWSRLSSYNSSCFSFPELGPVASASGILTVLFLLLLLSSSPIPSISAPLPVGIQFRQLFHPPDSVYVEPSPASLLWALRGAGKRCAGTSEKGNRILHPFKGIQIKYSLSIYQGVLGNAKKGLSFLVIFWFVFFPFYPQDPLPRDRPICT